MAVAAVKENLSPAQRAEIRTLYRELGKLGRRYRTARNRVVAIRKEAEPIIAALALTGEGQVRIAEAFDVVRETIRRVEMVQGVDRGDPRATKNKPDAVLVMPGSLDPMRVRDLYARLRVLGHRYKVAREKSAGLRAEAEPVVVALANLGEEQLRIAQVFDVVRETIRRMEIANGVDRGDSRVAPGARGRKIGRVKKAA